MHSRARGHRAVLASAFHSTASIGFGSLSTATLCGRGESLSRASKILSNLTSLDKLLSEEENDLNPVDNQEDDDYSFWDQECASSDDGRDDDLLVVEVQKQQQDQQHLSGKASFALLPYPAHPF